MDYDPLISSLESPKYNFYRPGLDNVFQGWVFFFGARTVTGLVARVDGLEAGRFPVHLPREDVAPHVPSIPAAGNCGFHFTLACPAATRLLAFDVIFDDGGVAPFFEYDLCFVAENQGRFAAWNARLDALPMPPPELVHLTQGHENVAEYKNCILPAALNMRTYLKATGVKPDELHKVLDFGCGSARVLKGWHVISPGADLFGCDMNSRLIEWNRNRLAGLMRFSRNDPLPPLEYPDSCFDFLYLLSVFTHVALSSQRLWVREMHRVLRPGGILLVTLHGELYVRNSFHDQPDKIREFLDTGFLTTDTPEEEGANAFGAFHGRHFAEDLFTGFELLGYFPQGSMPGRRMIFQVALVQDVYVFRKC